MKDVLPKIGTPYQQRAALHSWVAKPERQWLVDSIQRKKESDVVEWMGNVGDMMQKCQENPMKHDNKSMQETALTAFASKKRKRMGKKERRLGKYLKCKSHETFRKLYSTARKKRILIEQTGYSGKLM